MSKNRKPKKATRTTTAAASKPHLNVEALDPLLFGDDLTPEALAELELEAQRYLDAEDFSWGFDFWDFFGDD